MDSYAAENGELPEPAEAFPVDFTLHKRNRARLVERLRALPSPGLPLGSVVLLQGTPKQFRDETDHQLLTRQEAHFHYLFGVREPDFFGTVDILTGIATLYVPRLPAAYAVWMGPILSPEHFRVLYGVDRVLYSDELRETLAKEAAAPAKLLVNKGYNRDGEAWAAPATFDGIEDFEIDSSSLLYDAIVECRVIKTEEEIALMQYVNNVTSDAHLAVMRGARPGLFEYQLEANFLHSVYFHGKCRHSAYFSVCGCGPNAAVLHYGSASAPNERRIEEGDMLLLDMGAEYHRYASDITCSFPASGTFTPDQRGIFEAVAAAQAAVMSAMKPGVPWPDMHALAYKVICQHLVAMGLLVTGGAAAETAGKGAGETNRGADETDVSAMIEAGIGAVFMPHGLGHLMGIDPHDPGGYPAGATVDPRPGFSSLRCVRKLLPGMVITVEPGIYFIDCLLDKALADPAQSCFLVPAALERFRGFGGVRLEDDVLVTADGCRNLTNCPRTVAEVEAVLAGRITHRSQLTSLHYEG